MKSTRKTYIPSLLGIIIKCHMINMKEGVNTLTVVTLTYDNSKNNSDNNNNNNNNRGSKRIIRK